MIKALIRFIERMDTDIDPVARKLRRNLAANTLTKEEDWEYLEDDGREEVDSDGGTCKMFFQHSETRDIRSVGMDAQGHLTYEDHSGWTIDTMIERLQALKAGGTSGDTRILVWEPETEDWEGVRVACYGGGTMKLYTDDP